jgi:hypothetical protein
VRNKPKTLLINVAAATIPAREREGVDFDTNIFKNTLIEIPIGIYK